MINKIHRSWQELPTARSCCTLNYQKTAWLGLYDTAKFTDESYHYKGYFSFAGFMMSVWRCYRVQNQLPNLPRTWWTRTRSRPLAAMLASIPPPLSPLTAILMLNSHTVRPVGWCRNNRRAQHSVSVPGRKWPGQLLVIQPRSLFGWPTLWHYLFSTVAHFLISPDLQSWMIQKHLLKKKFLTPLSHFTWVFPL